MALTLPSLSVAESVVGLDIGETLITAAQVETHGKGGVDLVRAAWEDISPRAGDDDLVEALHSLWQRGKLTSYTVCSCLRTSAVAVRHFRFPNLSDDELKAALWLEAEETLQVDRSDILMDWHEHEVAGSAEAPEREGVVVAAPTEAVDAHLALLEAAGLFPVVLDAGCTAAGNLYLALKQAQAADDSVIALVNLSGRCADMAIMYDGDSMYPRTLISPHGGWAQKVDQGSGWNRAVDYLLSNLHDMLKYYQFKLRRKSVARVLLTGEVPPDEAFRQRLEIGLNVPVKIWNPLAEVRVRAWKLFQAVKHDPRAGTVLTTSMGLALRR